MWLHQLRKEPQLLGISSNSCSESDRAKIWDMILMRYDVTSLFTSNIY
jgi:hypothetical protein